MKNGVPETQAKEKDPAKHAQVNIYYESTDEDDDDVGKDNEDEPVPVLPEESPYPRASDYPPVPEAPLMSNATLPLATPGEEQASLDVAFPPTIQASELLNVSRDVVDEPSQKRAPSPSDAALARKPPGMNTGKNMSSNHEVTTYNSYENGNCPIGYNHKPLVSPYYSESWSYYPSDSLPYHYYSSTSYDWKKSKPIPASTPDRLPFGIVDTAAGPPRPSTENNRQTQESYDNSMDRWKQSKPHIHSATHPYNKDPAISIHQDHQPGEPQHVIPETQAEQEVSRKQSSRLDISNLVNEVQSSSQQLSHKRKADELSSDDDELPSKPSEPMDSDASSAVTAAYQPTVTSLETQLPDVQTIKAPAIPTPALESQIESPDPFIGSSVILTDTTSARDKEPPRKRPKTTSTSSRFGGVAKFVSGVAVGVVGVIAAIIATAPASVQEEALREATMQY